MNNIHKTGRTWQTPFGAPLLAIMLFLGISQTTTAQYCAITPAGGACLTNITFGTITAPVAACATPFYTLVASSPTTTTNLATGTTVPLTVTTDASGGATSISLWIDYNGNTAFEASEHTIVLPITSTVNTATIGVPIPAGAIPGATRMRVRSRLANNPNGPGDFCLVGGSGSAIDYTVTIIAGTPCTGAPAANTTTSSATSVCAGTPFNLSLITNYSTTGITYQWQSSPTIGGTYTNIVGATSLTYAVTSQTVTTAYRCVISCGTPSPTTSTNPIAVLVTQNAPTACYCAASVSNAGDTDIGNVTFGTLNNGIATPIISNTTATGTYTNNTAIPAPSVGQGTSVPLSLSQITSGGTFFTAIFAVYIDYNQNGSFADAGELVFSSTALTSATAATQTGIVSIPGTATLGSTRMRILLNESSSVTPALPSCNPLPSGYGEVEDYTVNIIAGTACAGAPATNTAVSSVASVCSGVSFNLSLNTNYATTGLTYQWQSAPVSTGVYAPITGATASIYTATQTVATLYRCIITCTSVGGSATTATPVSVALNSFTACYCTPIHNAFFGSSTCISNVTMGTIINTSAACATPYYTAFASAATTTTSFAQGASVPLTVASTAAAIVSVWIDYNQNGLFDATEWTQVSTTGVTGTVTVAIPATAIVGLTKMRIRSNSTGSPNAGADACSIFFDGESEDYFVTITAGAACALAPAANTVISSTASVCSNPFTLSLGTPYSTTGITFQWQSSPTLTGTYTSIAGANATTYTTTQLATTSYRCLITCTSVGGSAITATPVTVTSTPATFATLPYAQNFEATWLTSCVVAPLGQDTPDNSWRSIAGADNDASWRADNTTTVLSGWSSTFGSPITGGANTTARYARFHSYNVFPAGDQGSLDLYVNLNTPGTKTLTFSYVTPSTGVDKLELLLSTDGGLTFAPLLTTPVLAAPATAVTAWTQVTASITSTSATGIIRFLATGDNGSFDIGLDEVNVTGPPTCPTTVTFAPATLPNAIVGVAYNSGAVTTNLTGTVTYSSTTLPVGFAINGATGAITAPATAITAATTLSGIIIVANTTTPLVCNGSSAPYSIVVNAAPTCATLILGTTAPVAGTVGTTYSFNASVTPTTSVNYTTTATLPAGLTLGLTTGIISGNPSAATVATGISVTIIATQTIPTGCTPVPRTVTIIINPVAAACPTFTVSTAVPTVATVGAAYSLNGAATASSGTLTYSVLPALPAGLVLNAATGAISGTPTAVTASASYVVTASTSTSCSAPKTFVIEVKANLATAIDNALGNLVKVSPNPSKGDFSVDFGTINMAKSYVRVYDAQGKVVFTSENNPNLMVISLEKFANGIYLMEVETSKGRILKRLAKQ